MDYRLQYNYYPDQTDIVPLAAFYSGSNYFYSKNFGTIQINNTATWKIPFGSNINVTDNTKLSFQLGGDGSSGFVGGVYGYNSNNEVIIDFNLNAYRRGIVMFGPRSFYKGPETGLPKIVAMVGNFADGEYSAAELQIGGHITTGSTVAYDTPFRFTTPLTSNLYGVYGFNRSDNSGSLYGGSIIRSFNLNASGFSFNCYQTNGSNKYSNGNVGLVVIQ